MSDPQDIIARLDAVIPVCLAGFIDEVDATSVIEECREETLRLRSDRRVAADEIRAAADEIVRLRAEVAVLKGSGAKFYDIASSGDDPAARRRMIDRMGEESFAEHG